jgi:hypothetical protein
MSETSEHRSEFADDEDHYAVAGPFCLRINDTRHYEWSPKDGWKVVTRPRVVERLLAEPGAVA